MKLKTINSRSSDNLSSSLYIISDKRITITESIANQNRLPFIYFMVESIARLKVIDEGNLENILQAGLAKLKSSIMPGAASDLDILLAFMAPNKGGIRSIDKLINIAESSENSIINNDQWWIDFYNAFNITDTDVQKNIRNQVTNEITQEMGRGRRSSGQYRGEQRSSKPTQATTDDVDEIRKEFSDIISKGKTNNSQAKEKIQQLNAKLAELMQSAPKSEDLLGAVGAILLERNEVENNIGAIVNKAITLINRRYGHSIPAINEAGLLDKLRTMVANPRYTSNKISVYNIKANNKQGAKLAIILATENLRNRYNTRMSEIGVDPKEVTNLYKAANKPDVSETVKSSIMNKLARIHLLFNGKTQAQQTRQAQPNQTSTRAREARYSQAPRRNITGATASQDPLNSDITQDITGFKSSLRDEIYKTGNRVYQNGGNTSQIIAATKKVASKAWKQNPQAAQEVWTIWLRYLMANRTKK